ncbi:NUDIX hydrolase [Kitasatospora sp. NPDC091276]|uniref:NUDIX hydrolase n=1 Tax=Kitasatospora sp. NPDC091276 TaxID=3155300 RepID=UPI0034231C59
MTSPTTGSSQDTKARVRVCAALGDNGRVCLIRRQRPAGLQLSLPGGRVENGEDPTDALRRELLEEPGLDLAVLPASPVLRFVQDQETERPGETTPPAPGLHRPPAGQPPPKPSPAPSRTPRIRRRWCGCRRPTRPSAPGCWR